MLSTAIFVPMVMVSVRLCSHVDDLTAPKLRDPHISRNAEHLQRGWFELDFEAETGHINDTSVDLLFALKHRASGLRALRDIVANISDPQHPQYGKYLDTSQLRALLAPPPAALANFTAWLGPHGNVRVAKTADFIRFTASVAGATELFGAGVRFRRFGHSQSPGRFIVRATRTPSLPSHIIPHIDLIRGLCDFPAMSARARRAARHRSKAVSRLSLAKAKAKVSAAVVAGSNATANATATPCTFDYFSFPTVVAAGDGVVNVTLSWSCDSKSVAQAVDHFTLSVKQNGQSLRASSTVDLDHACGNPVWTGGNPVCQLGFSVPQLQNFVRASALSIAPVFSAGGTGAALKHAHPLMPTPWATPDRVRQLYNVPAPGLRDAGSHSLSGNVRSGSMAVLEFGGSFDPEDLKLFAKIHGESVPDVTVHGHNNPADPDTENTMDVQMMGVIGSGVPLTYWGYTEDKWLLDWAADVSAASDPPLVWSLSFGEPEPTTEHSELTRMHTELQKMAARGLTIVSTSGDWGTSDDVNCTRFWADFPSSSPYTTSTGATRILKGETGGHGADRNVGEKQAGAETACSTENGCAFSTGGGFSAVWPTPQWQADAVGTYLKSSAVNASQQKYFNSKGLGYNDLAALGNNVRMVISGALSTCGVGGGTSASGPIVAGLLALVNAARLDAGKPALGLANPLLYSMAANTPAAFNSIGSNSGDNSNQCISEPDYTCCAHGLREASEWDPLTGLGSINFAEFLKAALATKIDTQYM